ncbi:GroES-like protein [Xylaria bambusicola]|uniref:GroES-like protein n=1 Tax=Xylaria bambusicola TaxID=326684 RepID=UPI002007F8CB|nr:GroES-like protein [Xylaria bambusicola]KAI0518532.1 GroES-like protein [Xylaria bambusicola]
MMPESMRAIVISKFGGPEVLIHQDVPKPVPGADEVLIRVQAFGVNHAEMHMRKGEWDEWNPVTGLECVGTIESYPRPSSPAQAERFPIGSKVAAVMGGLGRNRPGGYGEYVTVASSNAIPLDTTLSWEQLAALPEVYCTAWSCLFTILDVKKGETLLIRGATSTLGQAALHLAVDAGAIVTATTRREERFAWLRDIGAAEAVREESGLFKVEGGNSRKFDKTLNLIGNKVLLESIALTRAGGRMLQAGWLGGLEPVRQFNPMVQMESGVHFSLFHSKVLGSPEFPLSGIPLQEIVRKIEQGRWDAKPARVFEYKDIVDAHRALDSHDVGGKIVIKH